MRDQPPRRALQVFDQGFVVHFDDASVGQHGAPMGHEAVVETPIAAELLQIVGVAVTAGEPRGEAGDADVPGVAPAMDDPGVRQAEVDQAKEFEVADGLVGDARLAIGECLERAQIGLGQAVKVGAGQAGRKDGKSRSIRAAHS